MTEAEIIPFDIKARREEYKRFVKDLATPPVISLTGLDLLCGVAAIGVFWLSMKLIR